jgi:hypothetical protein
MEPNHEDRHRAESNDSGGKGACTTRGGHGRANTVNRRRDSESLEECERLTASIVILERTRILPDTDNRRSMPDLMQAEYLCGSTDFKMSKWS